MNDAQFKTIYGKMIQNPKGVLAAARKGSPPHMMVLANTWSDPAANIPYPDALDVFLVHLQEDRVPSTMTAKFSDPPNLAFTAMLGISKMGEILPEDGPQVRRIVEAWPGIYKWSVYIFSSRIEGLDKMETRRRTTLDILSAFWYCICFRDVIRARMIQTPATIEMATRLWLEENDGPHQKRIDIPVGTCLFGCLLREAGAKQLDRVLKVVGGKAKEVAKLAITRLQRTLKGPEYHPNHISMHIDLVNSLSRPRDHPLRHALLSANVIWVISGALVKISVLMNTTRNVDYMDPMLGGFGYLRNCLESTDGFTWVTQAIDAGFLQAYCDCSPCFADLPHEEYQMIEELMSRILPPYLVYRSVVEAADSALKKIERGAQKERIERSRVRVPWARFAQLVHDRARIVKAAEEAKGTQITCDNMKCQKIRPKQEVRRCSACLTTFYCSKECQEAAWKEGDHKTMCKLKQRARLEGHADNISKRDYQFLHYLAMFDSRMHIGELRRAAARDFPNSPLTELVVLIDQSVVPPKYGVKELKAYTLNDHVVISENEEARNRALIEKAQAHPDKYTIVDMTIAGGDALNKVMTLATGGFWSLDSAVPHATLDTEKVRRQHSFENTLRWVFQAVDELDQSDLRRRMRRLGVKGGRF
ncbi:hypothetical protein K466DRAFT_667821, partial [Polyporus arcularius HHB13444]